MDSIGDKISKLRNEKNISQEKFAEAVDVSRQTVSKWERDIVQPTPENFKSICSYFNIELNYFFTDEEALIIMGKFKESTPTEISNELATAEAVAQNEPKFRTLKILAIVVAMVLLALCIVGCCIAAYVLIAPTQGGQYIDVVDSVNYGGIIAIIVGVVALAIFITLSVLLIMKRLKNAKNK